MGRSHPLPPSPSTSLLLGAPEQTSVPLWASVSPPVRGALSPHLSTPLSLASSFLDLTHDKLQGDQPLWGVSWGQLGVQVGTPPHLPGGTSKLRGTAWAVNLPSAGPGQRRSRGWIFSLWAAARLGTPASASPRACQVGCWGRGSLPRAPHVPCAG